MASAHGESAESSEPAGADSESTANGTQPVVEEAGEAADSIQGAGDVAVLVVDDDPSIGRLVEAMLTEHEFLVQVVSDPREVEAALRSRLFQVVILDYVIPGLSSADLLRLVQDTQPDASIVVVTAFPSVESALECLRARTFDYITKPFQVDVLKKAVLLSLDTRGLLRLSEQVLRERIGVAVRERRKALGLTLTDLARRTKISVGYLSQIELGKNSASIETLYRICLGLRLSVSEVFRAVEGPQAEMTR